LDLTQQANKMLESLTQIISTHIYVGQSFQITSPSIQVNLVKNNVSLLNTTQVMGDSTIKIPSFCDLLASDSSLDCQSSNIIQKVTFFLILEDLYGLAMKIF
jgi:hypothetical protein